MKPVSRRDVFKAAVFATAAGLVTTQSAVAQVEAHDEAHDEELPKVHKEPEWRPDIYMMKNQIKEGKIPVAELNELAWSALSGDETARFHLQEGIRRAFDEVLANATGTVHRESAYTLPDSERKMLTESVCQDLDAPRSKNKGLYAAMCYTGHQLGAQIAARMLTFDVAHEGIMIRWGSWNSMGELFVRVPYTTDYYIPFSGGEQDEE